MRLIGLAVTLTLVLGPLIVEGQQARKVARIGLLEATSAPSDATRREALQAGLRELGYIDGKNISIEYRSAEAKYERLPVLAAEMVQTKVDVIVAGGYQAIRAAQQATTTTPIVMVRTSDPVGMGFVVSLSRPGRNITGLSNMNVDVMSKYLELLRVSVHKLSRVAVLVNPDHPQHPNFVKRIQATGKMSTVRILPVRAASPSQIEAAFDVTTRERAEALIVLPDSFFHLQAPRIAELAMQHRLPTLFATREAVESGGLMSYGQYDREHYYRAATYVDKILKGIKPSDLPVEQATKIELVINLKTAKIIGLTIPQELLLRADQIIE